MLVAKPRRKLFRMRMGDGVEIVGVGVGVGVEGAVLVVLGGGRSFAWRHWVVSCLRTSWVG